MTIAEAQADVRRLYRGGFSGPLVSALVWSAANAVYQLVSPGAAMAALFLGGMLMYPLSAVILTATSGSSSLPTSGRSAVGSGPRCLAPRRPEPRRRVRR